MNRSNHNPLVTNKHTKYKISPMSSDTVMGHVAK